MFNLLELPNHHNPQFAHSTGAEAKLHPPKQCFPCFGRPPRFEPGGCVPTYISPPSMEVDAPAAGPWKIQLFGPNAGGGVWDGLLSWLLESGSLFSNQAIQSSHLPGTHRVPPWPPEVTVGDSLQRRIQQNQIQEPFHKLLEGGAGPRRRVSSWKGPENYRKIPPVETT